jgi:hypothetical protein
VIYYYIDLDCPPRRDIGGDELLDGIRRLLLADHVRKQVNDGKATAVPDWEIRFKRRLVTPDGETVESEMTVADVEQQAQPLREREGFCLDCPAAVTGAPYSCTQTIALPLSAKAEQWLVDRAAPPASLSGQLVRRSAEALGLGACETLDAWRQAGFLEAKSPLRPSGAKDGDPLTSQQLLHAMLLSGDLPPASCLAILLHTQCLRTANGGGPDQVLVMIQQIQERQSASGAPQLEFVLEPEPSDDASTLDLKVFLAAAYRAFSLETPLAIRM